MTEADSMLVSSTSVKVRVESMAEAPSFSVKERVSPAPPKEGASLSAAIVIVDVTAAELSEPSLTTHEMVRSAVLGFSEVLL